jgi:hypothetical protein
MMMRALKAFDYNRRRLQPGDVFELQTASGLETIEAHRKVFLTAQMAEDIDEPKKNKKRYQTTRLQAEDDE